MPRKKPNRPSSVTPGQVSARDIARSLDLIHDYVQPYCHLLERREQADHLARMLSGLSSSLERKSVEPIAVMHGIERRGLQNFVGNSFWDHRPLVNQLRKEVSAEIGSEDAQVIFDGSGFPKKGTETVGVKRQYCGRLGKIDSCVIGVFAAYVGKSEQTALVAAELYLPEEWCDDKARREKTFVPEEVSYRSQQQIARDLLLELSLEMPFGWVGGDDEFGKTQALRDEARALGKSYVFDVPEVTLVRTLDAHGRMRDARWDVERLRRQRKESEWTYLVARYGEKGPAKVRALALPVVTQRKEKGLWVEETLLLIEDANSDEHWACLVSAPVGTPLQELVRRARMRHRVEEVFEEAKGEVGLDHFEVRAWHGWYHHMTLCQIAHWFLVRERRRLGGKSTGADGEHDPSGHRAAADASTERETSGRATQPATGAKRASPARSLPRKAPASSATA